MRPSPGPGRETRLVRETRVHPSPLSVAQHGQGTCGRGADPHRPRQPAPQGLVMTMTTKPCHFHLRQNPAPIPPYHLSCFLTLAKVTSCLNAPHLLEAIMGAFQALKSVSALPYLERLTTLFNSRWSHFPTPPLQLTRGGSGYTPTVPSPVQPEVLSENCSSQRAVFPRLLPIWNPSRPTRNKHCPDPSPARIP